MSTADIADKVDDVRMALDRLADIADVATPSRRERIATALHAGILANPAVMNADALGAAAGGVCARAALRHADALIAELDKEQV